MQFINFKKKKEALRTLHPAQNNHNTKTHNDT